MSAGLAYSLYRPIGCTSTLACDVQRYCSCIAACGAIEVLGLCLYLTFYLLL